MSNQLSATRVDYNLIYDLIHNKPPLSWYKNNGKDNNICFLNYSLSCKSKTKSRFVRYYVCRVPGFTASAV